MPGYDLNLQSMKLLRVLLVLELCVAATYFIVASWHWAMLCDSPIMHYVNFLMDHGLRPYSQISDNNLPGAYLIESWAMHVFGGGDLAWRIYEFFLLLTLTAAMVIVAWPTDWAAGVYAGGMFLLLHGSEGPWYSVERDQVMTALLMVSYAAAFSSVRIKKPIFMLLTGFSAALATSIKPTVAPLAVLLVLCAAIVLKRRKTRPAMYVAGAAAGMAATVAINMAFLVQHHAVRDFWQTQWRLTTAYAEINRLPGLPLALGAIPRNTLALVVVAIVLAFKGRKWDWERWMIAAGAVVGLASYVAQHKGFLHHRYMFLTFLLLLMGLEFFPALREMNWQRWAAAAALAFTGLFVIPHYVQGIHAQKGTSDLTSALEQDLSSLNAGRDLQGQVQCLDMVYGCLNSLYHLGLVENSGFTGDLLIFSPAGSPAVSYYRDAWMRLAKQDPATVLVLTNEYFQGQGANSFDRISNWPEYAQYMRTHYTEVVARDFPLERGEAAEARQRELGGADAYRIYVRDGTPLLLETQARSADRQK